MYKGERKPKIKIESRPHPVHSGSVPGQSFELLRHEILARFAELSFSARDVCLDQINYLIERKRPDLLSGPAREIHLDLALLDPSLLYQIRSFL